jgi:hypothetical protein
MLLLKLLIGLDSFFPGFEAANITTLFVQGGFHDVAVELPFAVKLENTRLFVWFPIH